MTKWVYFMTLFVGAAVCVWLILLNAQTSTDSSSAALELERSEKTGADLKEQLRKAESQRKAADRKVERLEQEVAALTEQDLADYVDGTVLSGEFSTLQAMPEIAEALAQAQQAHDSQTNQTTQP